MRDLPRVHLHHDEIVRDAILPPLASFIVTLGVIGFISRSRLAKVALDRPNYRSLHAAPIPRLGGIGVLAGFALACLTVRSPAVGVLWLPVAVLAAVSLMDDLRGLPAPVRLVVHLIAAVWLVGSVPTELPVFVLVLVVLATAWMINLYNFMDGSDGLAGGMGLFGFSAYGVAALLAGNSSLAGLSFGTAAAAAGFLFFNFHPARIFLGDAGAVTFGFLAAAIGFIGWAAGDWTWWFPGIVFSPFIVDATVTLARRASRRERVWEPHRDHYYQRLVRMGWSHRKTALLEYALMTLCAVTALLLLYASPPVQMVALLALAILYAALARPVDSAWARFSRASRT